MKATIWVGKNGCTESTIDEIRRQVKDRKIVKVRWLRNTEIDPEQVAAQSKTELLQVRGRTMVLARRSDKKSPDKSDSDSKSIKGLSAK